MKQISETAATTPPDTGLVNGKKVWYCGTLTYTKYGLLHLFLWMLWGDFCYTMMEQLVPTLLPVLLKNHNASNLLIGLLVGSIPALLNFIMNPIISTSSDRTRSRWGRRIPYLFFTTPFVVLFLILLGWSDHIGGWLCALAGKADGNPALVCIILIAVFAVGFQLFNLFVASVFYYIFADVVPKPLVGRFMALFRLVGTAAGIIFSKYVLPMADRKEFIPWIFTGVALIYLFSFSGMCLKVKEGEYPPPEKFEKKNVFSVVRQYAKECFSIPFYMIFFIGNSINTASNACRRMFNLLFAKEDLGLSMEQYGTIMAVTGLVMLVAYIPLGWLVDKCHPLRVFIAGGVLIIITNIFGYFYCNDYLSFYIISFMIQLTYLLQSASSLPLVVKILPPEKFGQFCSANAVVGSLTLIVANAGGGVFIDCFGYRYIFVWDFIFTVIATILLYIVYRMWKNYGGDKAYIPPQVQ